MTGSDAPGSPAAGAAGAGDGPAPLDIVLTSPFAWPWVRRGSERTLDDLSKFLAGRGHRVNVYATGPDDRVEDRGGIEHHIFRQRLGTRVRQLNSLHEFAWRLQPALAARCPDVVFCMHYFDAYAALRARRRARRPFKVVFFSVGVLSRRYFRAVPLDAWLFRTVRREADLTIAVSRYAADIYRREFDAEAMVVPPPVAIDRFLAAGEPRPAAGPRVLFVSDANERRKGARVLCSAFPRVLAAHPGARLVYAGHMSEAKQAELASECARLGTAGHVDFLGVGRLEDVPALYRDASVTVLPSVGEAFGMVLVESLAAGTPVVAAAHGGPAEIVDGPLVGRLFDPGGDPGEPGNPEGLADAILAVLRAGKGPEVARACQTTARRYALSELGPVYEGFLRRVLTTGGPRP